MKPTHFHLKTVRIPTLKRHRLVVETNTDNVQDGCQTRSCHESIRFNVGDETLRDRSEQPVVIHDDSSHEQTMLNEVNMDFQIPGFPHSVVTHAQSTSVRELIQKIGGHLLIETVASRSFIEYTLDLSIPENVIKNGRPHGHRYWKLSGNKEYYLANTLKKRCIKKDYKRIHDRFLRDPIICVRMIKNSR